jgi:hypothetical protein
MGLHTAWPCLAIEEDWLAMPRCLRMVARFVDGQHPLASVHPDPDGSVGTMVRQLPQLRGPEVRRLTDSLTP